MSAEFTADPSNSVVGHLVSACERASRRRVPLGVIVLLALALWGGEYVRRDLWEPDEARYAYVAREMRDTGCWFVPHRHGEIYGHKPPLMFWLINAASTVTGGHITSVSTRLPSLVGSILSLWAATALAAAWFGTRTAWRTLFATMTAFLFWQEGGMGQIDALLCGLQMVALYCLFMENSARTAWRPALAYFCMGLAVLAKGPVGFILPMGAYITASLAAGEKHALRRTHWFWGPLMVIAFPAAWMLGARFEGAPASYFTELIFTQNVSRAAGDLGHHKSFFYYFEHFPMEFLPWTVFLPAAFVALRDRAELTPQRRRLIGWFLFVFLFFSFVPSKRQLYILLAYPAAAMFVAAAWEHLRPSWARVAALILTALMGLVAVAMLGAFCYPALPISRAPLLPTALVLAAGAAWLTRILRGEGVHARWFAVAAGTWLCLQLCIANLVYPALNPLKTPVALAEAAPRLIPPGGRLLIYQINGEILALYSGRPGLRVMNSAEVAREMRREGAGILCIYEKQWNELTPELQSRLTPHPMQVGSKKVLWCSFGPPSTP